MSDQPKSTSVQRGKAFLVRMPLDLHAALRAKSEADDLSMSQAIRRAIRAYVGGSDV